jgi:hypothetical protein
VSSGFANTDLDLQLKKHGIHKSEFFRRGMRDLGYVEGANVAFAFRFADGQVAKRPRSPMS